MAAMTAVVCISAIHLGNGETASSPHGVELVSEVMTAQADTSIFISSQCSDISHRWAGTREAADQETDGNGISFHLA